MKDATRKVYVCAITLEHVQFIGPFETEMDAGNWGASKLTNPCWHLVDLFSHDVAMPLELVTP